MTPFSQPKRKPGRPQIISDEALRRNRNDLLFVLEENWALIGWELQQADSPSHIRSAFRRISGINCRSLELFRMEYRRETTFPQFEATRKRFMRVSEKLKEALSNWEKCRDNASLAQSALNNISDEQQIEELRPICEAAQTALTEAKRILPRLQSRYARLDRAVQQREASLAQAQLLDFIRTDRYPSTPHTFANAMAGLPAIHWRQSMDRCLSIQTGAAPGLTYKQFLVVEAVLRNSGLDAGETVERMKVRLLEAKDSDAKTCNALAVNWYFLRRAIEFVLKEIRPPAVEAPYRVFAEYQGRYGRQRALDVLLKEREVLTTPAYIKERRDSGTPK